MGQEWSVCEVVDCAWMGWGSGEGNGWAKCILPPNPAIPNMILPGALLSRPVLPDLIFREVKLWNYPMIPWAGDGCSIVSSSASL